MTIKEDASYASPISSAFYEYYSYINEVDEKLKADADKIQCIVSNNLVATFGSTQKPELWDYADNVDTIDFLLSL